MFGWNVDVAIVACSDRLVGAEQLQLLDASWRTDMHLLKYL